MTEKYNIEKIKLAAQSMSFKLDEIEAALKEWKNDTALAVPENAIIKAFSEDGGDVSSSIDVEYKKVCLLNHAYSTRLQNDEIISICQYLTDKSNELSCLLRKGDSKAVLNISKALKSLSGRQCYVFATKYCSFAAPLNMKNEYPIHDSLTEVIYKTRRDIWDSKKNCAIPDSMLSLWSKKSKDEYKLEKYKCYKEAVHMMQDALSSTKKLTVKQLDQYLWKTIKDKMDELRKE